MEKTDTNEEQRDVRGPARGAVRGQRGTGETPGLRGSIAWQSERKAWPVDSPVQTHVF